MTELTIYAPLSPEADDRLRDWTAATPGASAPSGPFHVTLVPGLRPRAAQTALEAALTTVTVSTAPIAVRCDRVAGKTWWNEPGAWTAQLVVTDSQALSRLRESLYAAVHPVALDLYPEAREPWYELHVTLAARTQQAVAEEVANRAREAGLRIEFAADRLALAPAGAEPEAALPAARVFALTGPA